MPPDKDFEHLKLLAIFHYVLAGAMALISLIPIVHVAAGLMFLYGNLAPPQPSGDFPKEPLGWILVIFGSAAIFFGLSLATAILFAARSLSRRRRYVFCLVMAGIECFYMPIGTILGVFTIIVLSRDSVKALFQSSAGSAT